MTLLLEQFVVSLKQPLPYCFSLENTLAEYLFPAAHFAIGWFDFSLKYDLSPFQSMHLQCVDGDRGYYSNDSIRERLRLNTVSDFLAASHLFRSCQIPVQELIVQLKVVEDETVIDDELFIGAGHGKISDSLTQNLAGLAPPIACQVGFGIKPQNNQAEGRFAIATVTSTSSIAPYDLMLPRSCFRGEALAVGDYYLTIGFGIFEFATVKEVSLGTAVLVNYPHTLETEFLPQLRVQAEDFAQLQYDPRRLAQQYLNQRRMDSDWSLPSLTPEEARLFDLFLQTDLDHYLQMLEHPYIAARLVEFGQSWWSAIATGETLTARSAIAQPDLTLQPDQVSVPELPDGAETIVLKLPFINSNDAWILRNHHLPNRVDNCIYLHPDRAADFQINFGGDRLAFLSAIDYPTFAAEVTDLQYPHNRYPTIEQSESVSTFEQFISSYQPTLMVQLRRHVQHAIALLTEMQRLTPEQRFAYFQEACNSFQQIDWDDQLSPTIVRLQTQVRSFCIEFSSLDVTAQPALLQPFFDQLKQILRVVIGYLSSVLRFANGGQAALNQAEMEVCFALSRYKPVAWLDDLPTGIYLDRPMPSENTYPCSGTIDTVIQQTNQIWATAPPLQIRPLVQFRQLFPSVPAEISGSEKHFSDCIEVAKALYGLRAALLTTPATKMYQAELNNAVEMLSQFWAVPEPLTIATQFWQWFHRRKRSDAAVRLQTEELELAKLIFLCFPQSILGRLKVLQFRRLKVTGLQYFTNKHLGRDWGSRSVPITISQNSIVNSPDYGKSVVLVEGEMLGRLTAQSPRLPLGTTAIATIDLLPNSITAATTSDGIPLRIRSQTAQFLESESLISLEIVAQPSEQNKSKLLWYAKVDGETIGMLCHRSISVLKTLRRLQTGNVFQVMLQPLLPETAWVELEPSSVRYPEIWQQSLRG